MEVLKHRLDALQETEEAVRSAPEPQDGGARATGTNGNPD
jgi:hypothetical protein